MEVNSSKAVLVVAPGCPAELIQELLAVGVPGARKNVEVLLPPENHQQYGPLVQGKTFSGGVKVVPSPARRFFSTRHLKWLRAKLRSSEKAMVLLAQSPYQDPTSVMTSLFSMVCSGGSITLVRLEPGDVPGKSDQDLPEKLFSTELNTKFLAQELGRIAWSSYPVSVKNWVHQTERVLQTYVNTYLNRPVNFQTLDGSPEAVQKDLEHSLVIADFYLKNLPDKEQTIKGKKVLEIGPGINFGTALTLACHGAQVMVADKFLTPWDPDYHPKFYAALRAKLLERWPSIKPTPLDIILSQGKYARETISLHSCSLEKLAGIPDQSIDVVISNSVLEHLYDLQQAFYHLARITKPGGLGLHNVDFRDHRDFSRPLEFLLSSDKEFLREFKECHGEYGNRYRPREMRQLLEQAGFRIRNIHPIIFAEEGYLADLQERLRPARSSRYCDLPVADLRLLAGFFVVEKKPGATSASTAGKKSFLSRMVGKS